MTRLSSRRTRRKPLAIACVSTSRSCTGSRERMPRPGCARIVCGTPAGGIGCDAGATRSSSKVSMLWRLLSASMHRTQTFVQIVGCEVDAGMPRNGGKTVIEIKLGEADAVAQWLEALAIEIIGKIHHAFSSIVEFEPYFV